VKFVAEIKELLGQVSVGVILGSEVEASPVVYITTCCFFNNIASPSQ